MTSLSSFSFSRFLIATGSRKWDAALFLLLLLCTGALFFSTAPSFPLPSIWRPLAASYPNEDGFAILHFALAGCVSATLATGLVYLFFRQVLSCAAQGRIAGGWRRTWVARFGALTGAAAFSFSPPIRAFADGFTNQSVLTLLAWLFFVCPLVWLYARGERSHALKALALAVVLFFLRKNHAQHSFSMRSSLHPTLPVNMWDPLAYMEADAWLVLLTMAALLLAILALPRILDVRRAAPSRFTLLGCVVLACCALQLDPAAAGRLWLWPTEDGVAWWTQGDCPWWPPWVAMVLAGLAAFVSAGFAVAAFCRAGRWSDTEDAVIDGLDPAWQTASVRKATFERKMARVVLAVTAVWAAFRLAGGGMSAAEEQRRARGRLAWDGALATLAECAGCRMTFTEDVTRHGLQVAAQMRGRSRTLCMNGTCELERVFKEDAAMRDREALAVVGESILNRTRRDMAQYTEWAARRGEAAPTNAVPDPTFTAGCLALRWGTCKEEVRRKGVAAAAALARRVLDFYAQGGTCPPRGDVANVALLDLQWRLARGLAAAGQTDLAERLDAHNAALKELRTALEKERQWRRRVKSEER